MTPYIAYYICYQENKIKPELEQIILNDSYFSYFYAKNIIKGRWLEAEPIILTNSQHTYWYIIDIIKGRWLEAELIIKQNDYYWDLYCQDFNIKKDKCNWKLGL